VSVCLLVTSRCSIETDEWIELVFDREASLTYPTLRFKEILVPTIIKVWAYFSLKLCSWTIVATCCQLSSTKIDAQCDKLATVFDRSKLKILATFDVRPTTSASFSHSAFTSDLHEQRVARVKLRQLILVKRPAGVTYRLT